MKIKPYTPKAKDIIKVKNRKYLVLEASGKTLTLAQFTNLDPVTGWIDISKVKTVVYVDKVTEADHSNVVLRSDIVRFDRAVELTYRTEVRIERLETDEHDLSSVDNA